MARADLSKWRPRKKLENWRKWLTPDEIINVRNIECKMVRHRQFLRGLTVDLNYIRNRASQRRRSAAMKGKRK